MSDREKKGRTPKMNRKSGVLMHVSSLPGRYGIGSFGKEAFSFIDRLRDGGFSIWQTLPFCMPDRYGSPYSSYSAFSGNPFFIDLDLLFEKGYLTRGELLNATQSSPWQCEFERLQETRIPLLKRAALRALESSSITDAVAEFCKAHPEIADFCRFMAMKEQNGGRAWIEWTTEDYSEKDESAWQFIQYEFFREWDAVRSYAHENGIEIVGDLPIYVAYDSSDVYYNRDSGFFDLDKDGRRRNVAGVPPDFFAEEGQLWGNPLYNWKKMEEDGFSWWKSRLRHLLSQFDGVRIDHFRGIESFWSIPANAESAKDGRWIKGPGKSFIDMIQSVIKEAKSKSAPPFIIAEDLGEITEDVRALLRYSGFPGMRVFQFAFDGDPESPHLPYNYEKNCVAYTGTHDNNTLFGFLAELDEESREKILSYCGYSGEVRQAVSAIIRTLLSSHAEIVILPVQDLLRFGSDTRMNAPGKAEGNWRYRVTNEQLDSIDYGKFLYENRLFGRSR